MIRLLTDCHAHLCDARFADDLAQVLERAENAGIDRIVLVAETLTDCYANLQLARKYPRLLAGAGLYPGNGDLQEADKVVKFIAENHNHLAAIGEVGLDYWLAKDEAARERQHLVLQKFINLAKDINLVLNIHSRSAGRQTIAALLASGASRVQMHAFDGKASTALPAVEAGFLFSIPPSIIRSRQKQKLVKQLPLSCLLLESDSPVLGPNPEDRNEPANIRVSLQTIAAVKNMPVQAVEEAIRDNTARLYRS
jgi:TatD DNase family protein